MTAVGTASPMAQGQAMMSTVTAAAARGAPARPDVEPDHEVAIAIEMTTGTKTAESGRPAAGSGLMPSLRTRRMMRKAPCRADPVHLEGGAVPVEVLSPDRPVFDAGTGCQ
jgi:hypothetical protein